MRHTIPSTIFCHFLRLKIHLRSPLHIAVAMLESLRCDWKLSLDLFLNSWRLEFENCSIWGEITEWKLQLWIFKVCYDEKNIQWAASSLLTWALSNRKFITASYSLMLYTWHLSNSGFPHPKSNRARNSLESVRAFSLVRNPSSFCSLYKFSRASLFIMYWYTSYWLLNSFWLKF